MHSLRVDHRDQCELEVLSEEVGTVIVLIDKEADDSFHAVRSRYFTRMHPSSQNYSRLIDLKRSIFMLKNATDRFHLLLTDISLVGNCNKMYFPCLTRLDQSLLVVVDIRVIF